MKLHISSADLRLAYSVAVSVSFSSWMIRNRLKLKMSKGELLIFPLFQQQLLPSHLMTVLSIPFFRPKALRSSLTFLFRLHLTQSASKCYRLYLKNKQSLTFLTTTISILVPIISCLDSGDSVPFIPISREIFGKHKTAL